MADKVITLDPRQMPVEIFVFTFDLKSRFTFYR